jgi:hypothetical protein
MKISNSIATGTWILIAINLLMAFGSIWIFNRMAPAIEVIIKQNERSLFACEQMMSALVEQNYETISNSILIENFNTALDFASQNITEEGESTQIELIRTHYLEALKGDLPASAITLKAIKDLSQINRLAMEQADDSARRLGNSGAWGIVFMASAIFGFGLFFYRRVKRNLITPLEEIHTVLHDVGEGNKFRRCTGTELPNEIHEIYREVNKLLDNA